MSNAFDPGSEPDSALPPQDAGPGAGGGGGGPQGPPPGGGPILAMLGRQQTSPPVTAPGPGNMAHGMMLMTQSHGLLSQAMQNFPPNSPQWKDIHRSLGLLAKHMAQEAPGAGAQQTNLLGLIQNVAKNALLQKIMAQKGPGGGPGGGPPPGGGGDVPSPSTPLPGA